MNNNEIIVTGYCGSGSSAVIDLLKEYDCCATNRLLEYEHYIFQNSNSIFDLENKLLYNNGTVESATEAILNFKKEMIRLYNNDFLWFGGYKRREGIEFLKIVDSFLKNLGVYNFKNVYYNQCIKSRFSLCTFLYDIVRIILGRKCEHIGNKIYINRSNKLMYSFPNQEEYIIAAKKFVKDYFLMIRKGYTQNLIYDHLILPHNLYRFKDYFDENVKVIVVERDPRDVFFMSKYLWYKTNYFYFDDPKEFNNYYNRYRNSEIQTINDKILRISFEDLIYYYEKTVRKIEQFLCLTPHHHTMKYRYFIPQKSIKNTQAFAIKKKYYEESKIIKDGCSKYIYQFPYKSSTSLNDIFP